MSNILLSGLTEPETLILLESEFNLTSDTFVTANMVLWWKLWRNQEPMMRYLYTARSITSYLHRKESRLYDQISNSDDFKLSQIVEHLKANLDVITNTIKELTTGNAGIINYTTPHRRVTQGQVVRSLLFTIREY